MLSHIHTNGIWHKIVKIHAFLKIDDEIAVMKTVPYESAFGTLMHPMVTMSANIAHVVNIILLYIM